MNVLLDTVQQLQLANEVFRKQLMDAGIEPDPMPAAKFHPQLLMVSEDHDRTFLEENELMNVRSLETNQKIEHLSNELNNVAIAISQTINYVQLRYLTQMLDVVEHVTSQKRARAMSNSFLSDMLSRGLANSGALDGGQYRLKGGAIGDHRSQLIRQSISPMVLESLRGDPGSPDLIDTLTANRAAVPMPKFQYASPTSSQLRIFVPEPSKVHEYSAASSIGSMSRARSGTGSSIESGAASLKRSSSDISLNRSQYQRHRQPQQQQEQKKQQQQYRLARAGIKNACGVALQTIEPHRSISQQFLSPNTALLSTNN
ncbi:hypothetical protein BX616_009166 [Lobosporangium transversale]|nr:hypothetical protein BX616_009166 [Lobosporangium transversale]